MRSIMFIAWLFLVGVGGLFVGSVNLYNWAEFRFHGKASMMKLADPGKKITLGAPGGPDYHAIDVRYTGGGDDIVIPQKWLSRARAQALLNGGSIPIKYLSHDPSRMLYDGESPDSPWGWLAVGALALVAFWYSLKLKRAEEDAD